jgi:protein TonB
VPNDPGQIDAEQQAANHPVSGKKPGNRRLIVTLLVSVGLHAAALIVVLLLLRTGVPVEATVEKPTEVELVMEEHKGEPHPASAPSPSSPARPAQKAPVQQSDPSAAKAATPPISAPDKNEPPAAPATAADHTRPPADKPVQAVTPVPPALAAVQEVKREAEPTPPAPQPAPVISLQGTDSPSDARAFGDRVIPAKPDAVFHNRPPVYPDEAAQNGQQGTVVVLIHVSPAGTAAGVDLVRSSGYVLLDRAAQEAVLHWRFLPAVKDGQPVASDMTMGFIFDDLK